MGERLRQIRMARGMSLHDVQVRTGRHFSTIAKYERGERRPGVGFLRELAQVYRVTLGEIVEDKPFRPVAQPSERMDLQILVAMAQRMTPAEVAELTDFLRRWAGSPAGPG